MRVRVATTAALLCLPACSSDTTGTEHQPRSSTRTGEPTDTVQKPAPLSSAALKSRLLDQSDLGSGYLPKPERPARHDDVTVNGCPALSELGGDTAAARSPSRTRQQRTSPTAPAPRRSPRSCTATA